MGHIFPFCLGFKGGQGVATAVGLLFLWAVRALAEGSVVWSGLMIGLVSLAVLVLVLFFITRQGELVGVWVLPFLAFFLLKNVAYSLDLFFLLLVVGFIFFGESVQYLQSTLAFSC